MIISNHQLKKILGVNIYPKRLHNALNRSPSQSFLRAVIAPDYRCRYQEEGKPQQLLTGRFYDTAYDCSENATFYSVVNHMWNVLEKERFTASLDVGEVKFLEKGPLSRLSPISYASVNAQPILPGISNVTIAPGAMGLITPFSKKEIMPTLKLIGDVVKGVQAGATIDMFTLRNKLINEIGLKENGVTPTSIFKPFTI
jgi:hypothetical protein